MAPSPVMQVLRALDSAVDAALNDHTISTEELGHTTSFLNMTASRLNQYRNQFKTHVGKLPPETLARIFEFVVAPDKDIYTSSPARPCAADHLALVCKSWRTIALGWPRLWYHISDEVICLSDSRIPNTNLRRSGNTPLHVYAQIPAVKHSVYQQIYRDQAHRIQEAHLTVDEDSKILQSLSSPMPNLEFLTISVPEPYVESGRRLGLPRILGGTSTRLRALAIQSARLIPGNTFPNLVNLRMDDMSAEMLDILRLIRLLRHCPRLETFELANTEPLLITRETSVKSPISTSSESDIELFSDSGADRSTLPIAKLPYLRGLRMGYTDAAHALAVLALLKLPKHLAIRLDNLQPSGSAYMFQATYPPWPSLTAPPLSALYGVKGLIHLDIIHLRNAKKQPHLHLIAHGESSGIWFHICTRSSIRSSTRSEFNKLERLVAHLDTQGVITFRLTILPEAVECLAFLRPLLMEMPSLSRVLIKCSSMLTPPLASDLLHCAEGALMPSSSPESSSPDDGAAGIPAPTLGSLGIQMECPKAPVDALDALVRLTASRAQSGHPIRSLECNISGTTQEDLASVAEYVEHLDVTSRPLFNEISCDVPAVFKMKNDYWELFRREDGMEGWDLPE